MRSVFFPDTMTAAAAKKFPLFLTFFCQFLFRRTTTYYVPFRAKSRGIYKHFAKIAAKTAVLCAVWQERFDEVPI